MNYTDFAINNKTLKFKADDIEKFELLFFKERQFSKSFIDNFRSFELDYKKLNNDLIEVSFSNLVY